MRMTSGMEAMRGKRCNEDCAGKEGLSGARFLYALLVRDVPGSLTCAFRSHQGYIQRTSSGSQEISPISFSCL